MDTPDSAITGVVNSAVNTTVPTSQVANVTPNHGKIHHKGHAKNHATADTVTISRDAINAATSNLTANAVTQAKEVEGAAKTYEDKNSKSVKK